MILWGIDKSAKDIGCAVHVVNREHGNSQLYTQLLGSVEDACECHSNLKATFFSKDCPLNDFLQSLVYDHYQVLIVKIGIQCQSFIFTPYPTMNQCTVQRIKVDAVSDVDEDDVNYNEMPSNGLPPEIPMLTKTSSISVNLVVREPKRTNVAEKAKLKIVGFQFVPNEFATYCQEFSQPIELEETFDLSTAEVAIKQINGHAANDYKQSLILAGICSAGATCSCVCCLREKSQFHLPSERLQKYRGPNNVPTTKDAPKREGENSVIQRSKRYAE